MTDAELTAAADDFAQTCYCAGPTCSGCEANTRKIFLAGAQRMRESCAVENAELKERANVLAHACDELGKQLSAANARIEKLRAALEQNQFALQCMIIKWNGAVPGLTEQQVWDGAIAARDATRKLLAAHGGGTSDAGK